MSLTHIATQSIPTVLWMLSSYASFTLVPTPSVPETNTGFSIPFKSNSNNPENPPKFDSTFAVCVLFTLALIRSTCS